MNENKIYLGSIGTCASIIGFGYTLSLFKKRYNIDHLSSQAVRLGFKALGIATLITFTGFVGACYAITNIWDVKSFEDLRNKSGGLLPRITKPSDPLQPPKTTKETLEEILNLK